MSTLTIDTDITAADIQLKPEQQQALAQAENEVLKCLENYEIKLQSLAIAKIQLGRALLNMRQIAQGLGVWERWQQGDMAKGLMRRLGLGESASSIQRIMRQAELLGELRYLPAGDRPMSEDEQHAIEAISQNMSARAWDITTGATRSAQHEIMERAAEDRVRGSDAAEIRDRHQPQQQTLEQPKPRNQHLPEIGTQVTVLAGDCRGMVGTVTERLTTDLVMVEDESGISHPVLIGHLEERNYDAVPRTDLRFARDELADKAAAASMDRKRLNQLWGLLMKVQGLIDEALHDSAIGDGYRVRFEMMRDEIERA